MITAGIVDLSLPAYSAIYSGSDALSTINASLDILSKDLRQVSLDMHDHPEIAWKEVQTAKLLSGFMEKQPGWKVKRSVYGTETGWEAVFVHGSGGRTIGINSEMDALYGIGHACGHNLIAIAGIGSALAVAAALKKHDVPGRVKLLGTPAEEADGGKIVMLNNGGYKDMDVCLMAHPTPYTALAPMLAVSECDVEFFGHNAHAAGAPWEGVNALDAAVLAYSNISALRQQVHPDSRIHGIIKGSEEWVCNIIPAHSRLEFGVRHPKLEEVEKLKKRVEKCIEAAALATGCKLKMHWKMSYADMVDNSVLGFEYKRYMEAEQKTDIPVSDKAFGSTDFGDVTYALPALHPLFWIPVGPGEGNHTPGFAKAAATPRAHEETIKVAKGLAATAWRVLTDDEFFQAAKEEFETERKPKQSV